MLRISVGSQSLTHIALAGVLAAMLTTPLSAQTSPSSGAPVYEVPVAPIAPTPEPVAEAPAAVAPSAPSTPPAPATPPTPAPPPAPAAAQEAANAAPSPAAAPVAADVAASTHDKAALMSAAEGVFGKGAKGLGEMMEKILADQGRPNAYIVGREVSGALLFGLRYGSGKMVHKVEGERPVYWTGPSLGIDAGGDATKTFVLVYNLYDSQDLYQRYAQIEGRAYFIGGLSATYMRRGDVVVIPIRTGVGMRLGANVGYMKFSEKSKWLPF